MIRELQIRLIPQNVLNAFSEIKNKKGILAQINLPDMNINGVEFSQVLRVKDTNIALSQEYIKIIPKRILINKVTGEESDRNLPVKDWTIDESSFSSFVNEVGDRVLFPVKYKDDEGNYLINPNPTSEDVELFMETEKVKTTKYLEFLIDDVGLNFKILLQMFAKQYVDDTNVEDQSFYERI